MFSIKYAGDKGSVMCFAKSKMLQNRPLFSADENILRQRVWAPGIGGRFCVPGSSNSRSTVVES